MLLRAFVTQLHPSAQPEVVHRDATVLNAAAAGQPPLLASLMYLLDL